MCNTDRTYLSNNLEGEIFEVMRVQIKDYIKKIYFIFI